MRAPEDGWLLVSFLTAPQLVEPASADDPIELGPVLGRGSFGTVRSDPGPDRRAPARTHACAAQGAHARMACASVAPRMKPVEPAHARAPRGERRVAACSDVGGAATDVACTRRRVGAPQVRRATWRGRDAAVKMIKHNMSPADDNALGEEARLILGFSHPNVLQVGCGADVVVAHARAQQRHKRGSRKPGGSAATPSQRSEHGSTATCCCTCSRSAQTMGARTHAAPSNGRMQPQ